MRNDYKIRPRPAFKGGGIALRGFGRAMYEEGGNVEENKNETISEENEKKLTTYERKQKNIEDRKEEKKQMLEKKGYETGKAKFSREKDRQSPTTQNIMKKYRENITDPTINFIDKITGTRPYREGSNKARKEILGYKKGGKIKKTKTKNRSKK